MTNCKYCKADCCNKGFDYQLEKGRRGYIPMTNADHVRSMTDEELAKFLDDCNSQGCVCPTKDCEATCGQCIVNWLKQSYKEEK